VTGDEGMQIDRLGKPTNLILGGGETWVERSSNKGETLVMMRNYYKKGGAKTHHKMPCEKNYAGKKGSGLLRAGEEISN